MRLTFAPKSCSMLVCALLSPVVFASDNSFSDRIQLSGFGRIVAGYLDEDQAEFNGYDDAVSFDQESLIGLQADVEITSTLSFTTQLLGHSSDNRESGVEWLYLTYRPTNNIQLRVGKQRTPFLSYSDVLDVGFAYPWISPPRAIYNDFLFSAYEGINAQYTTTVYDIQVTLEGYWGSDNSDLVIANEVFKPNVNDLRGVIFKFRSENLSGRFSVNTADARLELPQISGFISLLNQSGFVESARSLSINGSGDFYHAGLKYEELNWFVEAEYNKTTSGIAAFPTLDGFALTASYNWYPLSVFGTVTTYNSDYGDPVNEIPIGVSPDLDLLAFGYRQIFDDFVFDDSNAFTLGVRYDLSDSVAIKAAFTHIDGRSGRRSFFDNIQGDFNRRANLYQAALEWVF